MQIKFLKTLDKNSSVCYNIKAKIRVKQNNNIKSGCSAVGSEREKMIDNHFLEVISPKQGVGEANLRATNNDYATARSAREGART